MDQKQLIRLIESELGHPLPIYDADAEKQKLLSEVNGALTWVRVDRDNTFYSDGRGLAEKLQRFHDRADMLHVQNLPPIPTSATMRNVEAKAFLVQLREALTISVRTANQIALSAIKQEILQSLLELKALDANSRKTTGEIVKRANPESDEGTYKNPLAELVHDGLIQSKRGSGGGYWLTNAGIQLAKQLAAQ